MYILHTIKTGRSNEQNTHIRLIMNLFMYSKNPGEIPVER